MSAHAFHEIYLHITWHNNHDCEITPTIEKMLHEIILSKCNTIDGIYVHELGGTETHIHLAISINPTIKISDFIGLIKGHSSHEVNTRLNDHPINWKKGYGVVSFSKRNLKLVKDYIINQKEHHKNNSIIQKLEKFEEIS